MKAYTFHRPAVERQIAKARITLAKDGHVGLVELLAVLAEDKHDVAGVIAANHS